MSRAGVQAQVRGLIGRLAGSDQRIGQARPREREGASHPCANHGGADKVAPLHTMPPSEVCMSLTSVIRPHCEGLSTTTASSHGDGCVRVLGTGRQHADSRRHTQPVSQILLLHYSPTDSGSAGDGSPISRAWHMVENRTLCIISRAPTSSL